MKTRGLRLDRWLHFVIRGTWLLVGACLGAVLVILVNANIEALFDGTLYWGIAIGIGLCVLALFLLAMLRPREMQPETAPDPTELAEVRHTLIAASQKLGLDTGQADRLFKTGQRQLRLLLTLGLRLWSGVATLGMAVAIVGSVIAMITAVAAIRQVGRIDAQNALIETQIEEARASRAASVFAAQLASLLTAIDAERAQRNLSAVDATSDGAGSELLTPSGALQARIQAVIDTAEPYARHDIIDQAVDALNTATEGTDIAPILPIRTSPQRGQLLRLLLAAGIDFNIGPPFDFSQTDLSGITLQGAHFGTVDLGGTDLSRSNLMQANLNFVDLTNVNLSGAVLNNIGQLRSFGSDAAQHAVFTELGDDPSQQIEVLTRDQRPLAFFGGDRSLADVLIIGQPRAQELVDRGWIGNAAIAQPTEPHAYFFADRRPNQTMWDLNVIGISAQNRLLYQDARATAQVDGQTVIRLGSMSLFDVLDDVVIRYGNVMAPRDPGFGCVGTSVDLHAELEKLIWFGDQPTTHPKWRWMTEAVIAGFETNWPPTSRTLGCVAQMRTGSEGRPAFLDEFDVFQQ